MDGTVRTIGARLGPLLTGLAGLGLFLLASAYGYHVLSSVVADTEMRKQARETLLHSAQVLSLLKDVETGQRGFLMTGDPSFLDPYRQAREGLGPRLSSLRESLHTVRMNGGRFETLEQLVGRRVEIAAENVALRQHEAITPLPDGIQSRLEEGRVLMERIRAEFALLESELRRRIRAIDEQVVAQQARARLAVYVLAGGAGALLLLREQGRRVRAERALTESAADLARMRSAELESVFQALPDLYFRVARDGTLLGFRGRPGDLYLPPEQFIGRRVQDVLPAQAGEQFGAAIEALAAAPAGSHRSFEYALPMPGGDRHFEARLSRIPERDEIALVVRDIEARYQAEASIRKWADAFEHCAHGIALGDARTNRLMACNPALGALLDQRPEDLVGRAILDIYAPAEHALLRARIARVDVEGRIRYESLMLRRDGGTVPVQLDLVSVPGADGQPRYRVATIQDISERRAATVALEKARDDLRAFALKLDRDIEAERRRLAREVHDQLGQIFTALKLNLMAGGSGPSRAAVVDALLDQGIRVARRISADLRPPMLDDLGLGPALAHFAHSLGAQAGCGVEVDIRGADRLGEERSNQLFRIAQEALTNVARHAGAALARVAGAPADGHYLLSVDDDGRGLGPAGADGLGVLGMRERAALIGAELEIGASPMGGTRLVLRLPLADKEDADAHPAGG